MKFEMDIFNQFDKKWALLTAGNKESFNTMTISWGGLGTLWGKDVASVYVRKSRYTHDFMDREDYFTISFYAESYKKILSVLGSESGRDINKMSGTGLNARILEKSVTFKEAEITLVCKKLFCQELSTENIPKDIVESFYDGQTPHDMYIGEVVDIL